MNGFERITAAMNHKPTDHIPVYPILAGVTRKLTGIGYQEWATDSTACADAFIAAVERFDLDCVVTLIDLSIECDAWGQKIIFHENDAPAPDYNDKIINSLDDYEKIQKADYTKSRRMMMTVEVCQRLVKKYKGQKPIIAFVFGPLGTLSMMRNQQDLYLDLYDDPDTVKAAAREVNETLKDYCRVLVNVGVDAIMLDTLFASGSVMSKSMWLDVEGPLVKELADTIRDAGAMVMVHNCGEKCYFDAQIETMNPVAISFLFPPDDCKDFSECKEKYGDKVTLIGCIPPPDVLMASDEEWEATIKEQIDVFAPGGGFILATGCEYPSNAELTRAETMIELARTYGSK